MTPSKYTADPGGYLGNQSGHILIGFLLSFLGSVVFYCFAGEFPNKIVVLIIIAAGYFVFEISSQRWYGWDTIEDLWFVAVYGAGATLLSSEEVVPGSLKITVSPSVLILFVCAASIHFAVGATIRLIQACIGRA